MTGLIVSSHPRAASEAVSETRRGGFGVYGGHGGGSVFITGGVFPLPCDCLTKCVSYKANNAQKNG